MNDCCSPEYPEITLKIPHSPQILFPIISLKSLNWLTLTHRSGTCCGLGLGTGWQPLQDLLEPVSPECGSVAREVQVHHLDTPLCPEASHYTLSWLHCTHWCMVCACACKPNQTLRLWTQHLGFSNFLEGTLTCSQLSRGIEPSTLRLPDSSFSWATANPVITNDKCYWLHHLLQDRVNRDHIYEIDSFRVQRQNIILPSCINCTINLTFVITCFSSVLLRIKTHHLLPFCVNAHLIGCSQAGLWQ